MALFGLIGWKLCARIITSYIQMCLGASYNTDFTVPYTVHWTVYSEHAPHEAISILYSIERPAGSKLPLQKKAEFTAFFKAERWYSNKLDA